MRQSTFVILLALMICSAGGATYNASTANLWDVQAAVNLTTNGDTVIIPAGKAYYTNRVVTTYAITLQGAGIGQTILVDEVPRTLGSQNLIQMNCVSNFMNRITGITFQGGTTNTGNAFNSTLSIGGNSFTFRLDHCMFTNLFNCNVQIAGWLYGVIDHCISYQNFNNFAQVFGPNIGGDPSNAGSGDGSWATPVNYGDTNFIYIETCTNIYSGYPTPCVDDMFEGARLVYRYNYSTNLFFQNHGTESSNRHRGARAFEVYGNTFVNTGSAIGNNSAFYLRSGSGVVFSNTVINFANGFALNNFRQIGNFSPWGWGNGTNTWDSNNASLIASGTHTGANAASMLTDSGNTYAVNQFQLGCEVINMTSGRSSAIYSNDAHNVLYLGAGGFTSDLSFNTGDSYQIRQIYALLDQIGRGSGDLIEDFNTPTNIALGGPTWPRQSIEGLYQWGNTVNGVANAQIGASVNQSYQTLQLNRDYFDGQKPGYSALVFPHPLVQTPDPNITVQPQNQTVTLGQSATFSVTATGTAPLTYFWYKNGGLQQAGASSAYTTSLTTCAYNGSIAYVVVSNSVSQVMSSTATLTVTGCVGSQTNYTSTIGTSTIGTATF